jgi:DNA-binding NtrC family response regulator
MLIERAISFHPRNNTAAAKSLGISRARLLRRMQQWGLGSQPTADVESNEVIFEELDES